MPKVIHFEIPAGDPEKVIKFYKDAFGWEVNQYEGQNYWLVMAGPKEEKFGINGAIYKKDRMSQTVNTISVEKLEEAMEKVKRSGGKVESEIQDISKVGRFVYAYDVEGTPFGMLQVSEEMKNMPM